MGVYDWAMKDDHLWWSPETNRLFGVDPANYVPTIGGFRALIHPANREGLWQRLNGCMTRRESFVHEFRVLRLDGSIRWVGNRAEFEYDAKGLPVRNYGVAIDITTQKAAETTLRENAQLFATLIGYAPGGYLVDGHFRIQSINSKALPVFAPVQPLIGRDFEEVMEILRGKETGARLSVIFQHTLTTGEQYISPPCSVMSCALPSRQG
jgi:PAS domain-containing protein